MQVAFVNRMLGFTRGGGEIWDLRVASELRAQGVDVTFYVGTPLTRSMPEPLEGFETVAVPTPHLRDLAYAAPRGVAGLLADVDSAVFTRRTIRRLTEAEYDVVHVNSDPWFGRFVDAIDAPTTITLNGPPHSFLRDTVGILPDSYAQLSAFDAVVATGMTVDDVEQRTDLDVHTINPGVDTATFSPAGADTEATPAGADTEATPADSDAGTTAPSESTASGATSGHSLLFVGRFVPAKNLSSLLAWFGRIRDTHPDATLTLVGDGPLRGRLERKATALHLDDAVDFAGYVGHDRLPAYYREADVFVLPSDHESFGMVLLEAMSCGLPPVAPDFGHVPRIVTHGRDGYLFETGAEFVARVCDLLDDAEKRRRFGDAGRATMVDGYGWRDRARTLREVFESVRDGDH
ncbi:MAG: glycosyltransferase family 4 protein [Haloarculaceae archaeon]